VKYFFKANKLQNTRIKTILEYRKEMLKDTLICSCLALAYLIIIPIKSAKASQNYTLLNATSFVSSVAFSSDHSYLAACSADFYLNLWNTSANWSLDNHFKMNGYCSALIQLPDKQLASTSNNNIDIWSPLTKLNGPLKTLTGHASQVYSLALSPNGLLLASGSRDNSTKVWNFANQTSALKTLIGHTNFVRALCFISDTVLASGSYDNSIKIWNVSSGK
jgi:WD40 repeat protein